MTAFRTPPVPDEAARVTAGAAALSEAPAGPAPVRRLGTTAPSASRLCDRLRTTGFAGRAPDDGAAAPRIPGREAAPAARRNGR